MQVFINEWSLDSQYSDLSIFRNALLTVLALAKAIQADFATCRNYYAEGHLYDLEYTAFPNESFMTTFYQIEDPHFKTLVKRILYEQLRVGDWRSEQVHDSEIVYECLSELCSGTSVAEATERLLQNETEPIILLNFTPSKFDDISVVIVKKNDLQEVEVDCCHTLAMVASWLQGIKQLIPMYDPASVETPRDEQTVLSDLTRFILTPIESRDVKFMKSAPQNTRCTLTICIMVLRHI